GSPAPSPRWSGRRRSSWASRAWLVGRCASGGRRSSPSAKPPGRGAWGPRGARGARRRGGRSVVGERRVWRGAGVGAGGPGGRGGGGGDGGSRGSEGARGDALGGDPLGGRAGLAAGPARRAGPRERAAACRAGLHRLVPLPRRSRAGCGERRARDAFLLRRAG